MGLLALVVEADGAGGGAHHRIDHDLADDAHALDVGAGHEDVAVLIADVVERPPHPLAVHQRFAGRLSFRPGNAGQHDLFFLHELLLSRRFLVDTPSACVFHQKSKRTTCA